MKRVPWPAPLASAAYQIVDNVIHSTTFDEPYFSKSGALGEKRHVFVEANQLEERLRRSKKVTILEFGFGLGLNLLSSMDAHASTGAECVLDYVAFEKYPLNKDQLRQCLNLIVGANEHATQIINSLPPLVSGFHRVVLSDKVVLTLIYGDATSYIKELDASVDVFYLDGFSPKQNEDLWNPRLFSSFRRLAAKDASFSTYSSAGVVRRGMSYAGFDVQVKKGFGQKKEMLVGAFRGEVQAQPKTFDNVTIIGAGIAGCSLALRASELGLHTRLMDEGPGVMGQASSNPLPLVRPTVSLDFGPRGQFSWYAYFYAMRFYRDLSKNQSIGWREISAIQLAKKEGDLSKMMNAVNTLNLNEKFLEFIDGFGSGSQSISAQVLNGVLLSQVGCLDRCQAGVAEAIKTYPIELLTNSAVSDIRSQSVSGDFQTTCKSVPVVLANPQTVQQLIPQVSLRLQPIRGQSSRLEGTNRLLNHALCGDGYLAAIDDGSVWSSGTFDLDDESTESRSADDFLNADRIDQLGDSFKSVKQRKVIESWVGVRYAAHDRMPHVGPVGDNEYLLTGFGSKGFTWGPLASEMIVSELLGLSCPVERSLRKRMNPLRFS
jgi:tRNA 5-methylaminomethyl-2-thiouridine biosynthesis bifunctional protein